MTDDSPDTAGPEDDRDDPVGASPQEARKAAEEAPDNADAQSAPGSPTSPVGSPVAEDGDDG